MREEREGGGKSKEFERQKPFTFKGGSGGFMVSITKVLSM